MEPSQGRSTRPPASWLPDPLLHTRLPAPAARVRAAALDRLEEFSAISARDLDAAHRVVAHDLERQPLPRLVPPQTQVELAARRHLLGVQRDDDVALLEAALVAGPAGHDPGHDHALLQRVGEDPEPRATRPADDPPV